MLRFIKISVLLYCISIQNTSFAFSIPSIFSYFYSSPSLFEQACLNPDNFNHDTNKIIAKLKIQYGNLPCPILWKKVNDRPIISLKNLQISDISVLKDLKHVDTINLNGNLISDISPLLQIKSLRALSLVNNCMSSLEDAKKLKIHDLVLDRNMLNPTEVSFMHFNSRYFKMVTYTRQEKVKPACQEREADQVEVPFTYNQYQESLKKIAEKSTTDEDEQKILESISIYLDKLKRRGLVLRDINLDDIDDYETLKTALDLLGMVSLPNSKILHYLQTIEYLLDDIENATLIKRSRPFVDFNRRKDINHTLMSFNFSQKSLGRIIPGVSYWSKVQQFMSHDNYKNDYLEKFYYELISDKNILKQATYPNESPNRRARNKKSDLAIFFSTLTKNKSTFFASNKAPYFRVWSKGINMYPSTGLDETWFSEIQYKMYALFNIYKELSESQKIYMISRFLHGSENCSDAKWYAVNDSYSSHQDLIEKRSAKSSSQKRSFVSVTDKYLRISKEKALTKLIQERINGTQIYENEYCTYFLSTWNYLAPFLGLEKVSSKYSQHIIDNIDNNFHYHISKKLDVKLFYKQAMPDLLEVLDRDYLGVFSNLIVDKEFILVSLLKYHNYIEHHRNN